jgi:hypothetical protein
MAGRAHLRGYVVDRAVFINYRGADSHSYGALLYTELTRQFGNEHVFLDAESIPPGADFVTELLGRVRSARVVLAVIGPRWLTTTDPGGRRRIDDPADWIRRELAEAFTTGVRVIPVLTEQAELPTAAELPADIAALSRCQFRRLRYREPTADLARLVADLISVEPVLAEAQAHRIDGGAHLHLAARPVVSWPCRVGIVPPRAASFQDRGASTLIAGVLSEGDAAVLTSDAAVSASVVSGLGGVGKTQLAVDYAESAWIAGELDLLVWVTAGSREAIESAYAGAAAAVTGVEDASPERGARRLLEWLAGTPARWLVVLDDLQSPADLDGLWPPATRAGRVVVTTRRRDAALRGYHRRMIEVGVFTPGEAHSYLTATLADQPCLRDGAVELAAELGFLPLALAQAAAYLLDRGLSCVEYRHRLADRQRRLGTLLPEGEALPDQHRATVAATWSLSIELANRLTPAGVAGPLLEVASMLDANGIPATVFSTPAVVRLLHERVGRAVGVEQARDGLGCLRRLSLITLDPASSQRSVRVHALVQRAVRDSLSEQQVVEAAWCAADALLAVWPEVERDTLLGQVLRANTEAVNTAGGDYLWTSGAHAVLFRAGTSLGESGAVSDAVNYFQRLHSATTHRLGPDHPDTLTTRSNFADWRGEAGDPAGALIAYEELLPDEQRVLGPDHPDTLTTRSNIARWRGEAGDPAGALIAYEELLPDEQRVLGPDHPDTLFTRSHIAYWRGHAGDLTGAFAAYEELLPDHLRVLGPDHLFTLITRSNIARWRGYAGDFTGAVAAYEELLPDQLRVLGPDHPDTLITRHEIAYWRGEAGDPAGALTAFEELLPDRLRVLGPDHPHTLTNRAHLARWQGEAGDPAGALTAFEELLPDRLRVLGPDHPHTLTNRAHLAYWRGEAGDPAGALTAFEELLPDQLRVLGPDHPESLTTRHNIARWRGEAGDPAGTLTAFEELLPDQLRVLGPDHPHTLTTRAHLAYWRKRLPDSTPR